MRRLIENHFGLVLLLSCLAGLALPALANLPNRTAVAILALLMFISCYRLHEGGFDTLRWKDILRFYVLRYGVLPILLWLAACRFLPDYATGIFLLSVLPAAVSSPAFVGIYGGGMAPAFAIVILSQLATPLLIPLQFALIGGAPGMPTPMSLLSTMVWCILIPMTAYIFLRRHRRSAAYLYKQNKLLSILLIAFVIALAIAKQRQVILAHLTGLAAPLAITLVCFAVYMAFGWWFAWGRPREERIAYTACSSFNNAGLGIALALLHFAPKVVLFVAVSEIAWSLLPMMLRIFLSWRKD